MNGNLKSQESFMLNLMTGLLEDLFVHHQLPTRDLHRDKYTIKSRTQSEGLSFLTKTLPALAKSVDSALLTGQFNPPTSFKRYKRTNLPHFLRGFFLLVFNEDGVLLEEPDTTAIKDLRQVGYLFYKYQLPYKERLVEHLFDDFVETDKDIQSSINGVEQMSLFFYAQEVIHEILRNFTCDSLWPKNGPGSVANSVPQWGRFEPTKFYPSLDSLVSYCNMYYCSNSHLFDRFDQYFDLDYEFSGTAKALAVPKDSRGPRLISSEPSEFMTYQQALKNALVPHIENHCITSGRVNFTRQSINRDLALSASHDQRYATLDLEKASDLVSMMHVDLLFEGTSIHNYLMNSRSETTELPDGRTVPLNKFAPMGSALCFPIEALVFFSLIVGERMSRGAPLKEAAKHVYVYGDDIIIETEHVPSAIEALELAGLRINKGKSCFTGKFRESCGVDAYSGVDITPIKIKKLYQEKPDATTLASFCAVGNNLFLHGYWRASDIIRRFIEKSVGKLPLITGSAVGKLHDVAVGDDPTWESLPESWWKFANKDLGPKDDTAVLGWVTWTHDHVFESNPAEWRWYPPWQCFIRRVSIVLSKTVKALKDGWSRLLRRGWYLPLMRDVDPFGVEPFDSAAFSLRYQAVKHGSWVSTLGDVVPSKSEKESSA